MPRLTFPGSPLARLACLALAVGATILLFIQFCDLVFDCGCRAQWAGAAEHCNVHNPSPPHCPWCLGDGSHGRWSFAAIIAAQAATAFWPGPVGWPRAVAAVAAFPAVGAVAALVSGLMTGYWR